MACLCGAMDCKLCRPENFYRGRYIDDWDEFNKNTADEADEADAVTEHENYQDWIDFQGEVRGECM